MAFSTEEAERSQDKVDAINREWDKIAETTEPFDVNENSSDEELNLYIRCTGTLSRAVCVTDNSDILYTVFACSDDELLPLANGKSPDDAVSNAVKALRKAAIAERSNG
jgi:hypothetical protein